MALLLFFLLSILLFVAYRFFVRRVASGFAVPDDLRATPAHRQMNGNEFIPVHPAILGSFQFKAISLDPVISPLIAVQFGWLPALLWLIIGSVFVGWLQDYLSVMMSIRSRGDSIGGIIGRLLTPRSRIAFLVLIYLYLMVLLSQFGVLLSTLMGRGTVASVIICLVPVGLILGQMIFHWRTKPVIFLTAGILITATGLLLSYSPVLEASFTRINQFMTNDVDLIFQRPFGLGVLTPVDLFWTIVIFGICYMGAILPTWRFALPMNSLSAWIIAICALMALLGWIVGVLNGSLNGDFEIPALVSAFPRNVGPIWPLIFVLISSGAVSGWNALVATHTTSRYVEKESQVLPVTTNSLFGVTLLVALVILLAAVFGVSGGAYDANQKYSLVSGPGSAFAIGIARTYDVLGLPTKFIDSTGALLFALILLTGMILSMRFARDISIELFGKRYSIFNNPYVGALFASVLTLILIIFGFWQWLSALFIGMNQLLAGVVLFTISIWILRSGKMPRWIPLAGIFLFVTSFGSLTYTAFLNPAIRLIAIPGIIETGVWLGILTTAIISASALFLGTIIFLDGFTAYRKSRMNRNSYEVTVTPDK